MKTVSTLAGAAALALIAGAAAAQTVPPATDWMAKPVPLEVFGQFPQIDTPRLSPDGKWIAMKVRNGGEQVLAIKDVGPGKPVLVARNDLAQGDKLGAREVRGWRWADDTHLLIALSSRDNVDDKWFDNIRWLSYNIVTHRSTPLAWEDSLGPTGLLWSSVDGPPHVLIQRVNRKNGTEEFGSPEVIDVDIETGAIKTVQRANPIVSSWEADSAGVVRFGSSSNRENGKERVLYRDDASSNFRTIANAAVGLSGELAVPSFFLAGSGKAYTYSRKDGYKALYEYDLATMQIGKKVWGVAGYDIDSAMLTPAKDAIEGVSYTDTRARVNFLSPRLKEIQSVLEETYGKGNVDIESADKAREKVIFQVAGLGQVPGYFLFDTKSGSTPRLGWYNEQLKNAQLNPVSTIRYKASDGKEIEAVLTMPRLKAGQKNLPLIVMPHGGPWARDAADWDPYQWPQAMAELGYVVVQPNYRGSTGYGRDWEKAAEKNWGYRMSDDLNDAVTYLAQQGTIDAKRVCIMGWSYGGYASARTAQRDGKVYRCAIAGAAPVNMRAMVNYDKDYLGPYMSKQALGSASDNLDDISPALHADQVSIPILIVQGAKDQRVPVAQAREFVSRLKKAGKVEGKDFTYLEQPLNTHNLLREEDRVGFLKAVKTFLDKNNPA